VGQIVQALQAQNLLDNTLIVFLSDNGAPDVPFARNAPLRGHKFNVLEGGIRVPFAVRWSARVPAHTTYTEPVSALDIVATAAASAGVSLPTDRVYDGLNVIPFLTGEQTGPERTLFWRAFGLGNTGPASSLDTVWAVRRGPYKLVTERATVSQPPALYDLSNDLGERQDLAGSQPGEVDALKNLFARWSTNLISPRWEDYSNGSAATRLTSLVLAGDWNGFNKADSTLPWHLNKISAPGVNGTPDALDWLKNTIHVASSGGDTTPGVHSFSFVAGSTYSQQWGAWR
jgi:arylsulfatase A-like enzyme